MVSLADIHISRDHEPDCGADEDLSYLSMESLFTPPGVEDERRMQVRAYNYWLSLVENGELPAVEELHPEEIADFGPNSVLVDLTLGIDRPAIVFLGDLLTEECGDEREIFALGDVPERSLLSRLTEHCLEVVATHSPVGFDAEFEGRSGATIYYRSILLPFSSNGTTVDFVFGVINWKEGAAQAAPLVALPTVLADDFVPSDAAPDLGALLAAARDAAGQARASEARSHDALYNAISITYDFFLGAEANPAGFEALQAGMVHREPARAAAQLVFGPGHDRTRLSEIIALLTEARRLGLTHGQVQAWLAAAPGGIKALVAEIRRQRKGAADPGAPRRVSRMLARQLRQAAPLAIDQAVTIEHEFGLIVARRTAEGALELIGDVGGEVRMLERAARRLLSA
jgi:hypothetical protein